MNKRIQNLFFLLGLVSIVIMVFSLDLTLDSLLEILQLVGVYFPLALLLWVFIYGINTLSWRVLLRGLESRNISFGLLYKITVSGFALNYITPGGLNGGEAYRILALKPYLGIERASSATLLYSIVHITSHLVFWFLGALVLLFFPFAWSYKLIIGLVMLVCLFLLWILSLVMKKGALHLLSVLLIKVPLLDRLIRRFEQKYGEVLSRIDSEVRELYLHRPQSFYITLLLEFFARLLGCLEISLLMLPLVGYLDFTTAYLIIAIASFMANLLFFMPMQIGGREGGFALAFKLLGYFAQYGLIVGLLVRLRELFWIFVGILLIKRGKGETKRVC